MSREAERRGHEVRPLEKNGGGVAIVVRGHSYELGIEELADRIPLTDEELTRWEREHEWELRWHPDKRRPAKKPVANGRLSITLPQTWQGARWRWTEGPRGPIEAKLAHVFAEIERRADEDDERAAARARREEQRCREELERLERQRLAAIEQRRVDRLTTEIQSWRTAALAREYAGALRRAAAGRPAEERRRVEAWCAWAEEWAERSDPVAELSLVGGLGDEEGLDIGMQDRSPR